MLEPLLYFGATVLATVTVALLVCRYRSARQKRISWGTVFMSSLAANASVFFGLGIYEEGWDTFTLEAWSGGKGGLAGLFVVLGVITVLCLLPALGVAIYIRDGAKEMRSRRSNLKRTGSEHVLTPPCPLPSSAAHKITCFPV